MTVVPEAARLDEAAWGDAERIIEDALSLRPPALRRQLVIFVRLLDALPRVRYGRPLRALPPALRTRVLRAVERAPLLLLRRGFWGLRTLVFMGYYARPAAAAEIGYRAHPRGWQRRAAEPPSAECR